MTYSPHQLAYFAHQLTRRAASNSMDRMAGALLDAQVDLNPHQIDAALFATSNPLFVRRLQSVAARLTRAASAIPTQE